MENGSAGMIRTAIWWIHCRDLLPIWVRIVSLPDAFRFMRGNDVTEPKDADGDSTEPIQKVE